MEAPGENIGDFGDDDRNEAAEAENEAAWNKTLESVREKNGMVADQLTNLSETHRVALEKAFNMDGRGIHFLGNLNDEELEEIAPLLDNLSHSNDAAANKKISAEIVSMF